MERDLWPIIRKALRRVARTRTPHQLYTDADILAVALWAKLHDRSINWACQRRNWSMQAWRRRLPNQSTMSRRLRQPGVIDALARAHALVDRLGEKAQTRLAILDGKPLELSEYTGDPEARVGRCAGRMAKGYKLHMLIDASGRTLAHQVHPMNVAECVVAQGLLRQAAADGLLAPGCVILADASYDSNPLHETAWSLGAQLIAPRHKPGTGLGHRPHAPGRVRSVRLIEETPDRAARLRATRSAIERCFGTLATFGGGLHTLPPWARRLHRVRVWVAGKLLINAARIARLDNLRRTQVA